MRTKQLSCIIFGIALVFILPACGNLEGDIEELRPIKVTIASSYETLTLTWNAIKYAVEYEIYYNTIDTIDTPDFTVSESILTQTINGLDNGTIYYCHVIAIKADGTSKISAMASSQPIGNMDTVDVTAVESEEGGQLDLSWLSVAGADQYEVYHSTSDTMPASPSQTVSTTTATISGLANGTVYNVWVKPKNANGYGGTSAMASGRTLIRPGPLTVSAANEQVTISWGGVPDATGYNVYYNTTGLIPDIGTDLPDFPDVAGLSQTIPGLTNGTPYYFWVTAILDGIDSLPSSRASGIPIGNMGTVTVTTGGSGELVLIWASVAGADEYEVYHSTSNMRPASPSQTVSGTTARISGLANGTTYYVWVIPKNANGSGTVGTASGTTLVVPVISNVTVANGQVTIGWGAITGAKSYTVYYGTSDTGGATSSFPGITGTRRTITGLTNGTPYYFWVEVVFTTDVVSSPSSRERGIPLGVPAVTVNIAYKGLLVTWPSVAGADYYEVYYSTNTTMPGTSETTTATSYERLGLDNGTTYYFWVRARSYYYTDSNNPSPRASGVPGIPAPGLYRGARNVGSSSLSTALPYISTYAVSGDEYYIVLGANDSISDQTLYYYDYYGGTVTVGITLVGYNGERTISLNADKAMFYIYSGVTLTLGENITLKGRPTNTLPLVCLTGGDLEINNGAKITGNKAAMGGGVYITSGNLTMNGGTISGNTANLGGGVFIGGGTFKKSGGTIYGNNGGANANTAPVGAGAAYYKPASYPYSDLVIFEDNTVGTGVNLDL
jgi:hypothetical protein